MTNSRDKPMGWAYCHSCGVTYPCPAVPLDKYPDVWYACPVCHAENQIGGLFS